MSNCLIFALGRWFKGYRQGTYLIIRKSRFGWWPHFLVADSLDGINVEHYVPTDGGQERKLPPLVFKGYIKDSD